MIQLRAETLAINSSIAHADGPSGAAQVEADHPLAGDCRADRFIDAGMS
jgi:hypothetical protein